MVMPLTPNTPDRPRISIILPGKEKGATGMLTFSLEVTTTVPTK